jgi:hypothetical protein
VPQAIPSAPHAKNVPAGGESPKVDKPMSPSAEKPTLEKSSPPSTGKAKGYVGAEGAPPSPTTADSRRDTTHDSPRPDPTELSGMSPQNSQSYGLGAPGGHQLGEGSSIPESRKQPRQYSHAAESLWDNLEFIQASYHTRRYVTSSVNTKAEQEQIKALYSSMKTTSELIDISMHILP